MCIHRWNCIPEDGFERPAASDPDFRHRFPPGQVLPGQSCLLVDDAILDVKEFAHRRHPGRARLILTPLGHGRDPQAPGRGVVGGPRRFVFAAHAPGGEPALLLVCRVHLPFGDFFFFSSVDVAVFVVILKGIASRCSDLCSEA